VIAAPRRHPAVGCGARSTLVAAPEAG